MPAFTSKQRSIIFGMVAALALVVLVLYSQPKTVTSPANITVVPLPILGQQTIRLRVAQVINPRFPALDAAQLGRVFSKATDLVQQNFNMNIAFEPVEQIDIADFFALRNSHIQANVASTIVSPETITAAQRRAMRDGVYQMLQAYSGEKAQVLDYARPYLTTPYEGDDFNGLSEALIQTLLTRLSFWYQQTASDGKPILDGTPYNEWVWWDSIGYGEVPYEVVITNQLVASAETYAMDVHSCLRGGISVGTTSYSKQAKLNTYSFVTTFPLLNDNPVLTTLRGEAQYSDEQISDYAAAVLTHELGHMLLHLGHPFGSRSCIMSPTPLLQFRSWYQALNPAECRLGSQPQMRPGAATIEYHSDW